MIRGAEIVFCIVPIGFSAIALGLAIVFGFEITKQFLLGVPLIYILFPLVSVAQINAFGTKP